MLKKLIATFAVAATAVFGLQAPAQAAWSDCGNYPGTICLFAHTGWGLPIWRQYPSQIDDCRNLTGFDNTATVISNNTPGHNQLRVWRYLDCEGESFLVNPGQYYDLTGDWWNDKASSLSMIYL